MDREKSSMLGFEVEGEKKAEFGWRLEAAASGVKLWTVGRSVAALTG